MSAPGLNAGPIAGEGYRLLVEGGTIGADAEYLLPGDFGWVPDLDDNGGKV